MLPTSTQPTDMIHVAFSTCTPQSQVEIPTNWDIFGHQKNVAGCTVVYGTYSKQLSALGVTVVTAPVQNRIDVVGAVALRCDGYIYVVWCIKYHGGRSGHSNIIYYFTFNTSKVNFIYIKNFSSMVFLKPRVINLRLFLESKFIFPIISDSILSLK